MLAVAGGILMQSGSCVTVTNLDPGGGPGSGEGPPPTPSAVTVQFINQSTVNALDVQFHASAVPIGDDVNATLFDPANRVTEDIGFAGTGLIPAGETDQITLNCNSAVSIGTLGGLFRNPETGEEIGTGEQRAAEIDLQYYCGEVVTLSFLPSGTGFETILIVE
jgi:hypothetical protein